MSILFAVTDTGQASRLDWYLSESPGAFVPVDSDMLSKAKPDRVVFVAPGTDIFSGRIEAVTRSEKQLREIALYQLEDDLSQPLTGLHVAIGGPVPDAERFRRVSVVSQTVMAHWLEQLNAELGKAAETAEIVSETSLLAETGDTVLFDGDGHVLFATGGDAVSVDTAFADQLIPALLQDADNPAFGAVTGRDPVLSGTVIENARDHTRMSYPGFMAHLLWDHKGIDLRQGVFRSAAELDLGFVRKWAPTLVLAAVSVAVWLGYTGYSSHQIEAATDRLYKGSVAAYRAAFPEEGPVANPLARVTERLQASGAARADLPATTMLSAFYSAISRTEGVELVSVSFSSTTGRLTSSLRFSGYQDRDTLKQEMERVGLSIELGGVAQEDGFLIGQAIVGAVS